jgi:hypothetical protein
MEKRGISVSRGRSSSIQRDQGRRSIPMEIGAKERLMA